MNGQTTTKTADVLRVDSRTPCYASVFAFMKAMEWSALNTSGMTFSSPTEPGQPQRFIPVFNSREDAEKFAGEETDLIMEMKIIFPA